MSSPDPSPALRYAVLHHTGVPSPHFDVLVEPSPGADLATWRSPAWPVESPTPVERIKDHRRIYLDYEGEVGQRRGRVDRVAGGTCRVAVGAGNVWTVNLTSGAVGTLVFRPVKNAEWELYHVAVKVS
jgi:hypothetical protein